MRHAYLAFAIAGVIVVACGVDVEGTPGEEEGGLPSGSSDASTDGGFVTTDASGGTDGTTTDPGTDAPTSGCATDACALPSAASFSLVVYGNASDPCPTGFTSTPVIENPTGSAGACKCGSCTSTADCKTGDLDTFFDDTGPATCSLKSVSFNAGNNACRDAFNIDLVRHTKVNAPAPVTTCNVTPSSADRSRVTSEQKKICTAPVGCADTACRTTGSMKACLVQNGNVACPSNAPVKHVVGTDFTMSCPACGCNVTATCTGTLAVYSAEDCAGDAGVTLQAGVCTATNNVELASSKWTGSIATGPTCSTTTASPTLAVSGDVRTICCP